LSHAVRQIPSARSEGPGDPTTEFAEMHQARITITLSLSLTLLCASACADLEAVPEDQLRDGDESDTGEPEPPTPIAAEELIGLHIKELEAMSAYIKEYRMDPYPFDPLFNSTEIADPLAGWPAHGLQWKDEATGSSLNFDIAAAHSEITSYPFGLYVASNDHSKLNAIEANTGVFSSDPNGIWMENNITDPTVGLVYAALLMHFWRTPVYVDATHNYPSGSYAWGSFSHTIALQKLTFTIPSAPDLLAACGLPANSTPSTALSIVPQCNHGAVLISDEVSLWNDLLCPGCPGTNYVPYDRQVGLPVSDLVTAWWVSLGHQGQMVFDPPGSATGEDLQGVAVLAEALADQILIVDENKKLVLLRDYVEHLGG
jgi:hypothetical protein